MSFYFFADIGNLNTQSSNAFGPAANITVDGIDYEQYRVTSMHTATQAINAIAVCKGQVFVQEQSENTDLLNIVLKPLDSQPFQFPKIKYFVYKGIKKSSLVDGNDMDIAPDGTNDLVNSIWNVFNKLGLANNPAKTVFGLDATINALNNSFLIEDVFNSTYNGVQFWNVLAGNTIGQFDQDSIGFEIILDSLYFLPGLEIARNSKTFIPAKVLEATPLQKDFFEHWHDKETILNFIDPCAFFGGFYGNNLNVVSGAQTNTWKGEDLYNNLLIKLLNKNLCYVDIKNEFNYSINYYKNYGTSAVDNTTNIRLKKGDSGTIGTANYYENNWPILVIDSSGFSDTALTFQIISLQLPTGNGDNPAPLIYLGKAFKATNDFPSEFLEKEKFISLTVTDNYTDEFSFGVPWVDNSLICSFTYLKFCKQLTDDVLPDVYPTQIRRSDYLDSLFPISMNFDAVNSILKTKVFDEEIYIDVADTHFFDGVFNFALSFDSNNVTLIANPLIVNTTDTQKTRKISELASDFKSPDNGDNILYNFWNNTDRSDFVINTLTVDDADLNVLNYESSGADYEGQFSIEDLRKVLALNFTIDQWNNIIELANTNFLTNYSIFLAITNKQNLQDDNSNGYTSFDIVLKGYQIDGDNIVAQQVSANINLVAYGVI